MNANEPFLDLPEGDDLSAEQLDAQVQKAQDQLVALKRQQEVIEKQKRELEELSRRQEQLQQGRMEMMEKFTRAAVVLERETFDAQKRVEQLRDIQDAFAQHMHVLESINPKGWEGADLNRELNRSLSAVDDARAEYSKSVPKIQPDLPAGESEEEHGYAAEPNGYNFIYWLKSGFAFTLPLSIVGLVVVLVLILR